MRQWRGWALLRKAVQSGVATRPAARLARPKDCGAKSPHYHPQPRRRCRCRRCYHHRKFTTTLSLRSRPFNRCIAHNFKNKKTLKGDLALALRAAALACEAEGLVPVYLYAPGLLAADLLDRGIELAPEAKKKTINLKRVGFDPSLVLVR